MRPRIRSPHHVTHRLVVLLLASTLGALLIASVGQAQSFPIDLELESGELADFGTVSVVADAEGGLVFDVEIDPGVVGGQASLHHVYLNLEPELRRLRIETLDPDARRPYRIHRSWRRLARSGTRFDWKVDLGMHRGRHRSGPSVQHARFRISARDPLAVEDLLPISMTKRGDAVQMALKLHRAHTSEGPVRYLGGHWEPPVEEEAPPVDEPLEEAPPSVDLPDPDALPPAPEGCRWVVDLFGGGDPVLRCG